MNEAGALGLFWVLASVCAQYGSEPGWEFDSEEDELGPGAQLALDRGSSRVGVWLWSREESGFPITEFEGEASDLARFGDQRPRLRTGSKLKVEVSGTDVEPMYGILGNRAGLLSLATESAQMARRQIPAGLEIRYEPGLELTAGSLALVLRMRQFEDAEHSAE